MKMDAAAIADELARRVSAATVIRRHEPLAPRTTLRIGGPADVFVEPANEADLAAVVQACGGAGVKFFVLGRGSNLLVRDEGFRGVVISLSAPEFSRITVTAPRLRGGAGAKLKDVVYEAKRAGLCGMEFLEGIPGSLGGALRMNAGAFGGATFDVVETVRVMDAAGQVREWPPEAMGVEYRSCGLLKNHLALGAVLRGLPEERDAIERRMQNFRERRWGAQPTLPSAGCTFKNPATIPAGRLVDELGLKGLRVGGAMVSPEHGNFIVNTGGATAADVLKLIELVQARARAERGIELQTEVEIVGG